MSEVIYFTLPLTRKELTDKLSGSKPFDYAEHSPLFSGSVPRVRPGEVRFGRWLIDGASDLPQVIICHRGEERELLAWLGTYFPTLAPLTQWCRLLSADHFALTAKRPESPMGSLQAHVWANIILGECFAQMREPGDLAKLSLAAALNCQAFVHARTRSVWGDLLDPMDIVRRWAEFCAAAGHSGRRIGPERLAGVFTATEVVFDGKKSRRPEGSPEGTIDAALHSVNGGVPINAELWSKLGSYCGAPQLAPLPTGSQQERLRAFDATLADLREIHPLAGDFIVGAAASSVANGRLQNLDLLKPMLDRFPTAPLWYALHAALLGRTAIGAEFDGFGRQIAKEIQWRFDLLDPPRGDISFDEFTTLMAGGEIKPSPVVRGLARSVLLVELVPGVSVAWSVGTRERDASIRADAMPAPKTPVNDLGALRRAVTEVQIALDRVREQVDAPVVEANQEPEIRRDATRRKRGEPGSNKLL